MRARDVFIDEKGNFNLLYMIIPQMKTLGIGYGIFRRQKR
jgi:hypothetical protein